MNFKRNSVVSVSSCEIRTSDFPSTPDPRTSLLSDFDFAPKESVRTGGQRSSRQKAKGEFQWNA